FIDDHFFIEINIPCWEQSIQRCDNKSTLCKRSDCKYYVRYDVLRKYHYKKDEPEAPLHFDDECLTLDEGSE
ncbi:hypothetical protein PMAYCL1PPCAC_08077, partial [Pristionchus mayeri]